MGVVFRARRDAEGDDVALKVLRDELALDELYRRRFHREARIASELAHEHVVPVLDFGEASGHLYMASRYVEGGSLSEWIALTGHLSLAEGRLGLGERGFSRGELDLLVRERAVLTNRGFIHAVRAG